MGPKKLRTLNPFGSEWKEVLSRGYILSCRTESVVGSSALGLIVMNHYGPAGWGNLVRITP